MRFIYCVAVAVTATSMLIAADPTFLRRYLPDIAPVADDLTANASGLLYRPAFGVGALIIDQPAVTVRRVRMALFGYSEK